MQRVRLRATPREGFPNPLFEIVANPPEGGETRLLDWNLANETGPSALFEFPGDPDRLEGVLDSMPEIASFDLHRTADGRTYCFLRTDVRPDSPMGQLFAALSREGLIVVKPIRYRNGSVHVTWVGDASVVQSALGTLPDQVDVEIESIRGLDAEDRTLLDGLSVRQREALETALDVGYYEQPRAATHEDVAERLGCAPSTASEHLLKAESKLIRAAFERAGRRKE